MNNIKLIIDNNQPKPVAGHNEPESPEGQYWPLVGLTLGSFLQAIAMDQQTCILEICNNQGGRGSLFFIQGALHDAACGPLAGEEAALELVSWEGVRFRVGRIQDRSRVPRRIKKGLISILMESMRQRDEVNSPGDGPEDETPGASGPDGPGWLEETERGGQPQAGTSAERPQMDEDTTGIVPPEFADRREAFQQCIEKLRKDMGDALIRSVIVDNSSGEVLAGHDLKLPALDYYEEVNRMLDRVARAHASAPGRYFFVSLREDRVLFFLMVREIRWAVDFNSRKMKLGVFLHIMVERLVEACEEALRGDDKASETERLI